MKKRFQITLIILYGLATIVIAVFAGLAANVGCGIGDNCSTVSDYMPGIITGVIILIAGGIFVWFRIKKYKRTK